MGVPLLLLPSPCAPAYCSVACGLVGPRRLAATPSSSVASIRLLLLRPSFRGQRRDVVARAEGGGRGEGEGAGTKSGAAAFFGDDGMVEDMDGYMDYLSLEYDSVWDTKPAWCQPWTILLSGATAVACSWVLLQSVVITAAVSFVISAWWYMFLYSYPKVYSEMIAERRKKVASGAEDTYGMEKFQ